MPLTSTKKRVLFVPAKLPICGEKGFVEAANSSANSLSEKLGLKSAGFKLANGSKKVASQEMNPFVSLQLSLSN